MVKGIGLALALLTTAAHAETVDVKYRGPVSLDNFFCPALKSSSFVNRICYDEARKYLVVQLRSTYYHYCAMEPEKVAQWVAASSLGSFYNREIKGGPYDCRDQGLPD